MINKRLQVIASMIRKGMVVADIGTDHAFLPIYLVENNISDYVIASDIGEGPLRIAKKNINKYGYEDNIKLVLSDGLNKIDEEVDVVVIAGMGYYTCIHILEEAKDRLDSFKQIMIEINKDVDKLRQYISDHNYTISNEKIVSEKGHDYIIIDMNTNKHDSYNEKEILCGPILMEERSDEYLDFVNRQIQKIDFILEREKDENRIESLNKIKGYWESV